MSDLTPSAELSARVRIMQILVGSIAAGPAFFAIIVIMMRQGGNFPPPQAPLITYTLIGVSLLLFIAHLFVPNLIVASGRKRIKEGTWKSTPVSTTVNDLNEEERMLAALYQTQLIVSAALVEGGVFALLIGFLIEGELVGAVVAALLWIRLVSLFPSRDRVERWIENQRDMGD
jgi:hypothetical protein